jgi:hypothetical protein
LASQYSPDGQSVSCPHSTQVLVEVLQIGVAPPQSLFCVQATQVFVVVLQTGVLPPQWLFWVQATQVALVLPLVPLQITVPPLQMPPVLPQTQLPETQRLLAPVHSLSARQPVWQVPFAAQYLPLGQCACWVHSTQALLTQEPLAQTFPHVPQLLGSLVTFLQTPLAAQ